MGYYVRAFCTSGRAPAISDLIAWLDECGFEAKAVMDNPNDGGSPDWQSFELLSDADKMPIPVECNRNTGEDSLARAEVWEFLDELEEVEDSPAKRTVVDHLQRLRFVVCCQLYLKRIGLAHPHRTA